MLTLSSLLNALNKDIEATIVGNEAMSICKSVLEGHDEHTPETEKRRIAMLNMEFLKVQYN